MWTYKHIVPNNTLKLNKKVLAEDDLGRPAAIYDAAKNAGYQTHIHLERGVGSDPNSVNDGLSKKKRQVIPNINPLTEFDPALDTSKPFIGSVRFKPFSEDVAGSHDIVEPIYLGPFASGTSRELIRTNVKYFGFFGVSSG
jgi:hypothetical protein